MYHRAAKKFGQLFWFYPLQELFFSRRWSLAVQISRQLELASQQWQVMREMKISEQFLIFRNPIDFVKGIIFSKNKA